MKTYIEVETKTFGPRSKNVGICEKISDRRYKIRLEEAEKPLDRLGTLFHELGHFACWRLFADGVLTDEQEHEFCRKLDKYAKRTMAGILGGSSG